MAYEITAIGSAFEWQPTEGRTPSAALVDVDGTTTRWLITYQSGATTTSAVVHEIDGAGAVTSVGTPLVFSTTTGASELMSVVATGDAADQALAVYRGTDNDGFARVLAVNPSTWAVTNAGSAIEFDTLFLLTPWMVNLHDDIFFAVYRGDGNDGWSAVLGVSGGTVTAQSTFEFDTANAIGPTVARVDDDHVIVVYEGVSSDGFVKTLAIDPSTFAVTATDTEEFDVNDGRYCTVDPLDGEHYLVTWTNTTAAATFAQVFHVDPSTYAVTAAATALAMSPTAVTVTGERPSTLAVMNHEAGVFNVVRAYRNATPDILLDSLVIDDTTWAVTAGGDTGVAVAAGVIHPEIRRITDERFALWWHEVATNDGFVQTFDFISDSAPTPQTWTGSTGLVEVAGTSEAFTAGVAAWQGSQGGIGVSGQSSVFIAGPANWAASAGLIQVAGTSGAFVGDGAPQVWAGSQGAVEIAGASSSFVPGGAIWQGSSGLVDIVGQSGAFIGADSPQSWAGNVAAIAISGLSSAFLAGATIWIGSSGLVTISGQSGSFFEPNAAGRPPDWRVWRVPATPWKYRIAPCEWRDTVPAV